MDNDFKVGDVVQLKSCGPKMTVTAVGEDGFGVLTIWCAWFVGAKQQDSTFVPGALAHA
jgi:uncharacterized protein YodC (DUF2158 family)